MIDLLRHLYQNATTTAKICLVQRHFITVLTLLIIGAGVWFTANKRPVDLVGAPALPEDIIQAMLAASRLGDARSYLDYFTDTLRLQLNATRQQMGEARFREYLVESQAPVMGVAITRLADTQPDRIRCEVEFVFRDKNQRQMIELKKEGERWRIDAMGQAVYVKPAILYGTKVFDEPTTNAPSAQVASQVKG